MSTPAPVDQAARERVRRELATSFVVIAGAGTGKTTLLVDRIEALVTTGTARLDEIAAVTFTENAAGTLKLRVRERLERARRAQDAGVRERVEMALTTLETAPIGTIHSLCAGILQERPFECEVPPIFRVADDMETDLLFGEAWDRWMTQRLQDDDATLLEAIEAQVPLTGAAWGERSSLRGLARTLIEQRDLVPLCGADVPDVSSWRAALGERRAEVAALAEGAPAGDQLADWLSRLSVLLHQAADLDAPALNAALAELTHGRLPTGRKDLWNDAARLATAREVPPWLSGVAARLDDGWKEARYSRLVRALRGVGEIYEALKAERGLLDFVDLLVKVRDALAGSEALRRDFQSRFRCVIVDEFQDTDPIQAEIVEHLAGRRPGALIVVGDPKQSIYRFRRADVLLLDRLAQEFVSLPGHAVAHLTQSFRSRPAIVRLVNRVFSRLIEASEEAEQPGYEAIQPPQGLSDEPSVVLMNLEVVGDDPVDLRHAEAGALAGFLADVAAGQLTVLDAGTRKPRPSRLGDAMVLVRQLTHVRILEDALHEAGLRFVVEGGKLFFDRPEVHEVLAVLRAIDDPGDVTAVVGALRSTFFGVSDAELVAHVARGGRFYRESEPGQGSADAVTRALELLHALRSLRTRLSPAALIERLYDETRVLAALEDLPRGSAQVANLEKVASLARDAALRGVITLRGFADLLAQRIAGASNEPDLPSTRPGDPYVVRILTVHKAKGLEAPIVAVFDVADRRVSPGDVVPLRAEGKVAIGFRKGWQPPGWAQLVRQETTRAWSEGRRLLYVALTRARDVLVLPLPGPAACPGELWRECLDLLPRTTDADVRVVTPALRREGSSRAEAPAPPETAVMDTVAEQWEAQRADTIAAGGYRPYVPVGATELIEDAPGMMRRGSAGGKAFGRLVHRLMEWAPLSTVDADAVRALAMAWAPVEGLDTTAAEAATQSVLRVLGHDLLRRARKGRVMRELPLWLPEEGQLIKGVADLVFEETDGLVVVDYKTDGVDETALLDRAAHHGTQLRIYGRALAQATGLPVKERYVLFTEMGRAVAV